MQLLLLRHVWLARCLPRSRPCQAAARFRSAPAPRKRLPGAPSPRPAGRARAPAPSPHTALRAVQLTHLAWTLLPLRLSRPAPPLLWMRCPHWPNASRRSPSRGRRSPPTSRTVAAPNAPSMWAPAQSSRLRRHPREAEIHSSSASRRGCGPVRSRLPRARHPSCRCLWMQRRKPRRLSCRRPLRRRRPRFPRRLLPRRRHRSR
mmetsp:Transcript_74866/g.243182  ORF Transcript_74866/g.243182 Transcript_74866/m.243182 type:complete len:204 (-) Transcript_74866:1928-2539(-)